MCRGTDIQKRKEATISGKRRRAERERPERM